MALGSEPGSEPRDEVRHLLRAPAPATVERRLRVPADPGRARADRARRRARHRLRVGGRAPLPRGVQPLERARGVPRGRVQRTKRIRLGHGIVQTPPPFNHPARIAERIAMLDLVSGGRAEFGTGESSSEAELGGFMIEPDAKRAMWEEGLRVAVRCMTETPFTGHSGEFVTMPPRNVVPKPMQKPHPPLWVACSRRDTIHLAAQHGIGALAFAFVDPEEAKYWVDDYYTTLAKEGVPIGDAVNANVACVTTFMCHRRRGRGAARAGSRARTSSATRSRTTTCSDGTGPAAPTCGTSTSAAGRARLRSRSGDRGARERRPARREGGRAGDRWPARRGRHTRPAPRLPAPLRGVRRRPGDLLLPGRQEPPRAHHGEPRALRA